MDQQKLTKRTKDGSRRNWLARGRCLALKLARLLPVLRSITGERGLVFAG